VILTKRFIFIFAVFCAAAALIGFTPRTCPAQQVYSRAAVSSFYSPSEICELSDPGAAGGIGNDAVFAAAPGGGVYLYSNSANCLYLFDIKGVILQKLDFNALNYSGRPFIAGDICASKKGGIYLFEAGSSKIVSVSKEFKINNFIVKSDIFAADYICGPADLFCDDNGSLLAYSRRQGATVFFPGASASSTAVFKGLVIAAGKAGAADLNFNIKLEGPTVEVTLNSAFEQKVFKTIRYPGFADGVFMAEKNGAGGLWLGIRVINNDRYEYHISEYGSDSKTVSEGKVEIQGGPVTKAVSGSDGRLLTLRHGEKNSAEIYLAELKKMKRGGDWTD
jgi:hypothetical protein